MLLYRAVCFGQDKCVKILLLKGADLSITDKDYHTPDKLLASTHWSRFVGDEKKQIIDNIFRDHKAKQTH